MLITRQHVKSKSHQSWISLHIACLAEAPAVEEMTSLLSDVPLPNAEVTLDNLSKWLEEYHTQRASQRSLLLFLNYPVRLADCILHTAAGKIQRRTASEFIWSSKEGNSRLSKHLRIKRKLSRCKSICSLDSIATKVVETTPTATDQHRNLEASDLNSSTYGSENSLSQSKNAERSIIFAGLEWVDMSAERWQYTRKADGRFEVLDRKDAWLRHLPISKPEQQLQRAQEKDSSFASLKVQERFVHAMRTQGRHNKDESRRRQGLPLLFEVSTGVEEVMTGHDTGTHDNHMSLELAHKLGYKVNTEDACKGQFQLPNGKVIEALGRVTAQVQFAQVADSKTAFITCHFNVFSRLALPALIGMAFLDATETLKLYRSRLVTLPAGWKRTLRLCAVGSATNQVTCIIEGRKVKANADTGSEMALISEEYAMQHGLLHEYSSEELELADGSLVYTSGFADTKLSIRTPHDDRYERSSWTTKTVRFHVLKHLQFDVILDGDIVDDFKIFQNGIGAIISAATNIIPSLATIIRLRTVEKSIKESPEKIKGWALSLLPTTMKKSS